MSDGNCLISCAGCGRPLSADETDELAIILAANETFRKDVLEATAATAVRSPLGEAVSFHGLYECVSCGPYQRLRVSFLDGRPRAAA